MVCFSSLQKFIQAGNFASYIGLRDAKSKAAIGRD